MNETWKQRAERLRQSRPPVPPAAPHIRGNCYKLYETAPESCYRKAREQYYDIFNFLCDRRMTAATHPKIFSAMEAFERATFAFANPASYEGQQSGHMITLARRIDEEYQRVRQELAPYQGPDLSLSPKMTFP